MIPNTRVDISIIITHWNRPNRLFELLSYLQSNYIHTISDNSNPAAIEIIVVDSLSESSDQIKAYLNNFKTEQTSYPFVKSIFLAINKGPSFARAQGLRLAQGAYIQFIDDDDWIHPTKLDFQFRWAIDHPEADLIASCWARVAADEKIGTNQSAESIQPQFKMPLVLSVVEEFTHLSACLLKHSSLMAVKAFEEEFWLVEDVHLQLKLLQKGATFHIAPTPSPLFFYRSSPESGSLSTASNRKPFLLACLRNLKLAEEILLSLKNTSRDHRIRLSNLYGQLARGFFRCDREIFEQVLKRLYDLNPNYLPKQPFGLRLASKLLGYSKAEDLSYGWHRVKQKLGISCRHP